jgi:hypothetical protein
MHGTVHVEGSAGSPGRLRFSAAAYSVDESTSSVTLVAQRVNGDDGAVSVDYATANGTARSGQDYGARQGTLSWADQDGAPRSFTVPILDDDDDEGAETFQVHLTGPTGGAQVAAPGTATVTINDDDDGPGSPPPAPGNLQAAALGASAIRLTWQDTGGEAGYRVERRSPPGGAFAEIGAAGADVTSFEVGALAPASFHLFRVRAENSAGLSGPSNDAGAATDAPVAPCAASATTLCLNGGRFAVEVEWRAPAGDTGDGSAVPLASIPDSGLFHFFSPSNLEMLIKVLEACALNSRYWVFYGATTNVEFVVKVSDTQSGKVRAYYNPLGRPAPPVQDTSAFATCP